MKKLLTLVLTLLCFTTQAQNRSTVVDTTFYSTAYGKERKLSIHLPPFYGEDKKQSYPVMYVFDGQAEPFTDFVAGLNNALTLYDESEPFIIVGIYSDNRGPELTPKPEKNENWVNNPDFGWGKGDVLEQSLVEEIIPLINKTYRTNGFTVGVGHSLGGTFVLHTKANQKGIFHSAIAISPNLMWDEENMLDIFESQEIPEKGFYYLSIGDTWQVEKNFRIGVERFDYLFSKKDQDYRIENESPNEQFAFIIDSNEDATHGTNFMISMPRALIELHRTMAITEDEMLEMAKKETFLDDIKKEYARLATWKGTDAPNPSESQLNSIAYSLSYEELYDKAVEVLNWGIELYPNAYNLYDSKAEMLLTSEQYEESVTCYKKALQVLKENKSEISQEDYEFISDMIKEHIKEAKSAAKE